MQRAFPRALLSALFVFFAAALIPAQTPHTLTYAPGKQITLKLPDPFDINIAATGLKRVRFFAKSPDGRFFVTSMHDLGDNRLGAVYILEGWDEQSRRFTHVARYLDHLRNAPHPCFGWLVLQLLPGR